MDGNLAKHRRGPSIEHPLPLDRWTLKEVKQASPPRIRKILNSTIKLRFPLANSDLFNSSNFTCFEADLDAMWVVGRFSEYVLNDAASEPPAPLILLLHYVHP